MIDTANILSGALSQALETMAFLEVMLIEGDMAIPARPILAEISFAGPTSGTIRILAGMDLAGVLAENIGALDQADDDTCADAMKELANVTCGLVLPVIASELSDVFEITVAMVKRDDAVPDWDEFTSGQDCCLLDVEGYMIACKLIIKD